jgi:penicillin-binding protein 1A
MFFKKDNPPAMATDIDSRLAAFDSAYAGLFPDDPKPWEAPTPAVEKAPRKPFLGKTRWWWFSRMSASALLLFILLVAWLAVTAPLSKSLQPIAPPRITLLASDGTPIARNGAIVDKPVDVTKLPLHVAQAFLSIEDRRFYSHFGIDPRGLARAAWSNAFGSGITQGGSTITQQLAKFTFLTPERSLTRKAREMLIAFWLEGRLTKDEILGRYLSNVYFGDNVYGLRAASLHYFYRQPENLTLSQSVMLAGLVQAPSRLAPTKNPARAAKRAKLVLRAMVANGSGGPPRRTRPGQHSDRHLFCRLGHPSGTIADRQRIYRCQANDDTGCKTAKYRTPRGRRRRCRQSTSSAGRDAPQW